MTGIDDIDLGGGVTMPPIGYGTFPLDDQAVQPAVEEALRAGYRMIDTAENYGNEVGVGRAIAASGLPRDQVFVTTKFNRQWHHATGPAEAASRSLERLGLDHLDLLLIHWPNPDLGGYVDAWAGMIELRSSGLVRAIGVSNFTAAHVTALLHATGVAPQVNQIQLDPGLARAEERAFHADHGIATQSWSPLGRAGSLLEQPDLVEIALTHGRTPAQVVLRWHLQVGAVPIPKSADSGRMRENLDLFAFELDITEMSRLAALDGTTEPMHDPERFGH